MTTVFPLRNLGPDAEPWGRTVQGAVSGLERDLAQAINSNNATDQMQTTQLNSLVQSQKILQTQQQLLAANAEVFRSSMTITTIPTAGGTFWYNLGTTPTIVGSGEFLVTATVHPFSYATQDYFEGSCSLQLLDLYVPEVGPTSMVVGSGSAFVGHPSGSLTPTLVTSLRTEIIPTTSRIQVVLTYEPGGPYSGEPMGVRIDVAIQPRYASLN